METAESLRILVADPELVVGEIIGDIVRAEGHSCVYVSSSAEAISALNETFDILFLHRGLSEIAIEDIIRTARERFIPIVILLSSQAPDRAERDKIMLGADGILFKPIDYFDITKVINKRLQSNGEAVDAKPTYLPHIMIVSSEGPVVSELQLILKPFKIETIGSPLEALSKFKESRYDILITDVLMDKVDGVELVKSSKIINPLLSIIVFARDVDLKEALGTLKEGVCDVLQKSLLADSVLFSVKKAWANMQSDMEARKLSIHLLKTTKELLKSNKELRVEKIKTDLLHQEAMKNLDELTNFKNILDHSGDAIYLIDPVSKLFKQTNVTAEKVLGYSSEELLKLGPKDIEVELRSSENWEINLERLRHHHEPYVEINCFKRKDGTTFPVEVSVTHQVVGSEEYLLAIVRDVSDRFEREKKIQQLSLVVEQNPIIVLITNNEGIIEYVNPAFIKITGYSYEEAVGQNPRLLNSGKQPKRFYENLWRAITNGGVWRGNFRNIKKDGSCYWGKAIISPLKNSKGVITNYIALQEDVTAQVSAEEHEAIQREQLFEASKLATLGTLVAGIGHEINNPNNFIMMNAPTLLKMWGCIEPILKSYSSEHPEAKLKGMSLNGIYDKFPVLLSDISHGSDRIKNIVSELRNFAKKDVFDYKQSVDLNETVKSACRLIHNAINKSTKNFSLKLGDNIPLLLGNSQRFEQVFIDLIQNSCQALTNTDEKVTVMTSYSDDDKIIKIIISDEGKGISEDNILKITDPFFTTKRNSGGTGLGLSIAKSIIEKHGGELKIESILEQGTIMTILIPV